MSVSSDRSESPDSSSPQATSQRSVRAWLRQLLGDLPWVMIIAGGAIGVYVLIAALVATAFSLSSLWATLLADVIVFVIVVSLRRGKAWTQCAGGPSRPVRRLVQKLWLSGPLMGITAFCGGLGLATMVYTLLESPAFDSDVAQRSSAGTLGALALTLLAAPLGEEALMRGLVYPLLRRRLGVGAAVVATTIVFAALHMNVVQFAFVIPLSVVTCLLYERTSSIWPCVGVHALINLGSTFTPAPVAQVLDDPIITVVFLSALVLLIRDFWITTSPGSGKAGTTDS